MKIINSCNLLMKRKSMKTLFAALLGCSVLVLASCKSTDTSYKVIDDVKTQSESERSENSQKKQFVLFKFGNIGDYISIDASSVFTNNTLSILKQNTATYMVDPKEKTAGFGSAYMLAYYYLFWDAESRQQLRTAIENYLSDFENKRLNRKASGTNTIYGRIPVNMKWGTIESSTPNNGSGTMLVGYTFKNKSPYFTFLIYPVHNNFSEVTTTADHESMTLNYFFTRAQLNDLLSILSEDKIAKIIGDNPTYGKKQGKQEADDYDAEDYVEAEVK